MKSLFGCCGQNGRGSRVLQAHDQAREGEPGEPLADRPSSSASPAGRGARRRRLGLAIRCVRRFAHDDTCAVHPTTPPGTTDSPNHGPWIQLRTLHEHWFRFFVFHAKNGHWNEQHLNELAIGRPITDVHLVFSVQRGWKGDTPPASGRARFSARQSSCRGLGPLGLLHVAHVGRKQRCLRRGLRDGLSQHFLTWCCDDSCAQDRPLLFV